MGSDAAHGFLDSGGTYITLDDPSANVGGTSAVPISSHVIPDYNLRHREHATGKHKRR
jgi:hypothetical protein